MTAKVLGFVLVVSGAIVIGLSADQWRRLVDVATLPTTATTWLQQNIPSFESIRPSPDSALFTPRWQALIGAGAVVFGGAALGGGFFASLLTAAVAAACGLCIGALTDFTIPPSFLLVGAFAIGYAFHARTGLTGLTNRGIVGFLLMMLAALAVRYRWINWEPIGHRIGGSAPEFFETWGDLCTWGLVLALTATGVALATQRRLRFFSAALLTALAFYAIRSGMTTTVNFPTLGKSLEDVNISNVPVWRWVIAGELILLVCILLYQSRGFGLLTLAFAITWIVAAVGLSAQVGTMAFVLHINDFRSLMSSTASPLPPPNRAISVNPFENWALPIPSDSQNARLLTPPPSSPNAPPLSLALEPTAEALKAAKADAMRSKAATRGPSEQQQREFESVVKLREYTIATWTILMAIIAGLIAASGLAWMSADRGYRGLTIACLWIAAGLAATWLWSLSPRQPTEAWRGWLASWSQSVYKPQAVAFLALLSCAFAGIFALAPRGRAAIWRMVSVVSIFIGTSASLVAIALLIHFGGFSPLPTWMYAAIAVGQSSLAWLLLLAHAPAQPSLRRARAPQPQQRRL